jgi:gamma-glutamyltranspeptidase / glutathione hydrolase
VNRVRGGPADTSLVEPATGRRRVPQKLAVSPAGMVATSQYHATDAGVEILRRGGNAFDAAVAAAFALGVCEPMLSGLGGQTMLTLHHAGKRQTVALDGSSRAPHRATPRFIAKADRLRGYRSATVPSTPAVLDYVRARYGRLGLEAVLAPAIALAEEGYRVTPLQNALAKRERANLQAGSAARFFLKEGKRAYPVGALFRQPVLGNVLRRLAAEGIEDFYTGQIARWIHEDMEAHGGLMQLDDLAQIPQPIERRPLTCRLAGRRVFTFPPPGAGRTLVEMLNTWQNLPKAWRDPDAPLGAVTLAEVIRRASLDRRDRPFDPNYYPQVEEKIMLSETYARRLARQIVERLSGRGETTHLSVMDAEGNAVALTQSIERVYGSCCASEKLGFLYSDYMSAFEFETISHPYYQRPNAVPWASVAPTLIFEGRRPWLAIGSPGSERITSSILQVLIRLDSQGPFEAVDAPRLHCSVEGRVSLEAPRMRSDIPPVLERHGFTVDRRDAYSFYLGCVQLVMRKGPELIGVADPRRDGSAGGPVP